MRKFFGFLLGAIAVFPAAPAFAQVPADGGPDPAKVRVRIGPLWMNPTISLTNIGIDQNVFNEPKNQNPKRDFTFTVTPTTDLWLHVGRTWVTGKLVEDLTWYRTYASERAVNNGYSVGWRAPFNRLVVNAVATYRNARERPGFEIDARSQRKQIAYNGSVELRGLSKTFLGLTASRQRDDYDKDAVFLDSDLHFELNRVGTSVGLSLRHQLTPLTSISLTATRAQDRFEFSSLRDSNSTAVAATIAFDPFALIKGSASFGYTDFQPFSPGLPNFQGATGAVDLSYTALGTTRFSVRAARGVQYSYDVNQPYYVQTGFDGSIAQQIFGPFDVVARAGVQNLAYRDRAGAVIQVSNRVDKARTYGGGVGYHMGKELRLGVNVDKTNRISDVSRRQYDDLKFGSSVTYGF